MTRFAPLAAVAFALLLAGPAFGQAVRPEQPEPNVLPFAVRDVGVDEKLGERVPGELIFLDHTGNPVRLATFLDGTRPVLLTMNYSRCPKICDTQLRNLGHALAEMEDFTAGEDYRLVTVSIDPSEGAEIAASRRRAGTALLGRGTWSYWTGRLAQIRRLAAAVGFRYRHDAARDEYHHSPVAVLLTPDGTISRYFHGLTFEPETLRLSLIEAGDGTVGETSDYFPLICYRYDPAAQAYVPNLARIIMAVTGAVFTVALGMFLGALWVRGMVRAKAAAEGGGDGRAAGVRREDAGTDEGTGAAAVV